MTIYNIIMALLVLVAIAGLLAIFLRPDPLAEVELEEEEDQFTLEFLVNALLHYVNDYQNLNVEELDMNKQNIEKIQRDKEKLEAAIKSCPYGDKDSKKYLKELTKQVLTTQFGINEETIDQVIRFDNYNLMSYQDKFETLLYLYIKKFDRDALTKLLIKNKLDQPHGEGYLTNYLVTVEELELTFNKHVPLIERLTYDDKLKILSQRLYSRIWGLGAIDDLVDMDIDGVRGGTSGIPATMHKVLGDFFTEETGDLPLVSYNSIWIMFKGKNIHLCFLGFGSEKELERVGKKIYKYDNPGTLSAARGFVINSRMDGARVVAIRPPFAGNWAFFVRKLDAGAKMQIKDMFQHKGGEKVIELLHWIISGCLNLAITGEQGSGKTTLMMSLVDFIKHSFTIRTQETAFELNLQMKYLMRDIVAFKETETVSGQAGINVQKKTDGSVNLMGEVADSTTAALTIQTGQTGSNQVMFTGHMKTAKMLVKYFRDCLCDFTGMTEHSAESIVAEVVNTNIHQIKEADGTRHTERISVIIPHVMEEYPEDLIEAQKEYYFRQTDRPIFDDYDLLTYEDGEYFYCGEFPEQMVEHICKRITAEERVRFKRMCAAMHEEAEAFWTQKGRVYRDGHVLSIKKGKELLEIEAQKAAAERTSFATPDDYAAIQHLQLDSNLPNSSQSSNQRQTADFNTWEANYNNPAGNLKAEQIVMDPQSGQYFRLTSVPVSDTQRAGGVAIE